MPDYRILYRNTEESFVVRTNETILDAAIRQGIHIPYSCRNGTCRTCLHHVVSGHVIQVDKEQCMITEDELAAGKRLVCMCIVTSDAVLEKRTRRRMEANHE